MTDIETVPSQVSKQEVTGVGGKNAKTNGKGSPIVYNADAGGGPPPMSITVKL